MNSNSQGMLHSEHMLDLKGTLHLKPLSGGGQQVINDTHLRLQGVGVIGPDGVAWVGTLEPGAAATLKFEPHTETEDLSEVDNNGNPLPHKVWQEPWLAERDQSPVTASRFPAEVLNVRQIVRLAQNTVRPGEVRLVGWIDEELPGQRIEPVASQARYTNVVIAHLKPASEPRPTPDENTHLEVKASDFDPEKEKTEQNE